jgi:hypothetical protein
MLVYAWEITLNSNLNVSSVCGRRILRSSAEFIASSGQHENVVLDMLQHRWHCTRSPVPGLCASRIARES